MADYLLGDIVEFIGGGTPDKSKPEYWNGSIPWASVKDLKSSHLTQTQDFISDEGLKASSSKLIPPNTVIIPTRMAVGRAAINSKPMAINQDLKALKPKIKLETKFLLHLMLANALILISKATGATVQGIRLEHLKSLKVSIPPLEEQKRIAGILDAAEKLRQKRQHSLELLDELKQSIFVDMFLKSESSDWPVEDIENLSKKIRTGPFGSQLLHSEFVDQGVAVLGIDNAVNNEFLWSKRRYISFEKYDQLKRFTVEPDDVLITIMGTIGRCAVVPQNIPLAINTKHLCSITLDQKKMMPTYLHAAFLNHPEILRQLGMQSKGAVMPGLNMGIIKTLKHPIPPLEIQKKFTERVMVLNEQKATLLTSHEKLDELFTSLQHKAFAGELSGTAA